MKLLTDRVCDICGKRRGRPYDHTECSKQRQARGGVKETVRPAQPSKVTTEFLIRTGERR